MMSFKVRDLFVAMFSLPSENQLLLNFSYRNFIL
jgi:hypothetical protein